jgi:hypothetical protein
VDAKEIVEYRGHLEAVWLRARNHWLQDIDPWVWGTPQIWGAGSQRSTYVPSTARSVIEHASDTQLVWEPRLYRRPVTKGREAERAADRVENGLHAVMLDAMLHEPTMAFKEAGKFLGAYGYAVIEGPLMDFEDRLEKPVKKRGMSDQEFSWMEIDYKNAQKSWNPIRIRAPHPTQVLLDPSERQPADGIRHDKRYAAKLRKLVASARERERKPDFLISDADFAKLISPDSNPQELVEVTEYWSRTEHQVVYRNEMILSEKNRWGFMPYNHCFAGFGMRKSYDEVNDPYWLAQGLIDPIMSGLKTQAQAMSAKQNALIERSYLRIMTSGDGSELAVQLAQEDAIIEGDDREISFLRYPDLERALFQIGNEIDGDIELGTFSRSVAGHRQQGVSTVGQQAILSTAATRKFASTNKQLNMMATVVAQNILRLVDRYGEAIQIGAVTLDPKDIHNDYSVIAEFQTLDPILQLQQREVGMREVGMGLKSHESYRENDLRVADESLEFKRLTKEQVRQTPEYQQALAREVAKEDGMLEMLESLREGAEQPPGPGGGGGSPGAMPQISAQAGGGATRALGKALTPDTLNPGRTPLPPSPLG